MTSGALLDSHSLLWLGNGDHLQPLALRAILRAASAAQLYTCQMSIWEMGIALGKKQLHRRPDLRGRIPSAWFEEASEKAGATSLPISAEIAAEAANVPAIYGYGDPGDCFLIATAHIHSLVLITRDARILTLAAREPTYLAVIAC